MLRDVFAYFSLVVPNNYLTFFFPPIRRSLRQTTDSAATADVSIPASFQPAMAAHLRAVGATWTVMIEDLDSFIANQASEMAASANVRVLDRHVCIPPRMPPPMLRARPRFLSSTEHENVCVFFK